MTDSPPARAVARRQLVERQILDAAWSLMAGEGVAAVSVREVARSVGLRQQSLTHYYPTKQALLDALFADGFTDLRRTLEHLPPADDPVGGVVAVAVAVVDYCVANPARYHLMLQRTLPSFSPSEDSYRVALGCLTVLVERLSAAGITDPADVALIRGLISGLAAEQIANDPQGRIFADQADRGIRTIVTACMPTQLPRTRPDLPRVHRAGTRHHPRGGGGTVDG
jgi:AcrR family transcriptional regulator